MIAEYDEAGQLHKLRPDATHPVSQGFICAKGLKFLDIANHPNRVHTPLRRNSAGELQPCSWDEAYALIGEKLRHIIDEHGVHAVGIYFGTPMIHHSLLMLTLFQWLRAMGTRNLYSAASQDNANKLAAQKIIHGREWVMPIADIEHADFALLLGTNPLVSQGTFIHMPQGTKTYDALIERGGEIVVVDPRHSESAQRWKRHLSIRPGTDVYLLLAILHELRDLYPQDAPKGLDTLLTLAEAYPIPVASHLTSIPEAEITSLVAQFRSDKRCTIFNGVGVNQGRFGTLCLILIQAIAYLSGNFDVRGGILFHPWANILQLLVGIKPQVSRIGGFTSHAGGLPCGILADEILTTGEGQIRALIVIGGNPLTSAPDETRLRQAFEQLDLLVSIDIFQNQTGALADVILPGLTWLERFDIGAWDAMYETAPMLQTAARARKPIAETRSEVRIIAELSILSGKPIFWNRWLARLWARIGWDAMVPILLKPLQWLFSRRLQGADGFPWRRPMGGYYRGRRRKHLCFWDEKLDGEPERLAAFADELQRPRPEHTFLLLGRRRRLAQNSWIHNASREEKAKEACAWLHQDDMARLNLVDGALVEIRSTCGAIQLPVFCHDSVQKGTVIVPHGLPDVNVNRLISSDKTHIEPFSGMHQMSGHHVSIAQI